MKTAAILARAGRQLQDAGFTRWTTAALLDYLNVVVRRVKFLLPDLFAEYSTVQLTAEQAEQDVPDAVLRFVEVVRNMGDDGQSPGDMIRVVDKRTLDAYTPSWRHRHGYRVVEWCPGGERQYLVNPPPMTAIYVEIRAVPTPAALTNANNEDVPLPDRYESALLHGVLAAAFAEDVETGSVELAAMHSQAFMTELGV